MRSKITEFEDQRHQVRDTTRNLIDAVLTDAWPRNGAVVDFGLDSQKHYEALYYPIRALEIMPKDLDAALGNGEKLTALALAASSNPHKDVEFYTSWDAMRGKRPPKGAVSEADKLKRMLGIDRGREPSTRDDDRER